MCVYRLAVPQGTETQAPGGTQRRRRRSAGRGRRGEVRRLAARLRARGSTLGVTPRIHAYREVCTESWPLQDIVIAKTVWCITYTREVGRGVLYCSIIVQ